MKTTYKNIISRSAKAACMGLALLCTSCLDFEPEAQMNDASVWSEAGNYQLFANSTDGRPTYSPARQPVTAPA